MKQFTLIIIVFITTLSFSLVQAQVNEIDPIRGLYYYSGTIDQEVKIEFNLQFNGSHVSGSYIEVATGNMYIFNGRMSIDHKGIGVLVYNTENDYIASIEANFVNEEDNFGKLLKGKWKSAQGDLQKVLTLKKVAEYAKGPGGDLIFEETLGLITEK